MADGTPQNATAIVAADGITKENGVTVAEKQAQRVKLDAKGIDGEFTDVSLTNPFPVHATLDETNADLHGQALGVARVSQITAKFFQQAPDQFLNVTPAGGATATGPTLGLAIFATGTATTASLLAQTPTSIMYATGFEAWASMAGRFTTPTSAASFQRLGIYNAVNGYFFGYNGLTFGLTIRVNSVDTFIAQTSWNRDTLAGSANSRFTSNGVPVALVPTNINMWRVRYGWYGAVTARFEVYSPDGEWVLVHQVRTANSQTAASTTNPDLPMTVEVSKTASDATNLIIACGGWAAGITSPAAGVTLSGQGVVGALNASVVIPLTSVGTLSFTASGTWVGTLSFQYSLDGLNWTNDSAINNTSGAFSGTTSVNGGFSTSVASYKFYRVIMTAYTSGSASIVFNTSPAAATIADVEVAQDKYATFKGRTTTFRTPGRAGTTGQKIFALHNATGSTKVVKIGKIAVDVMQTVAKALTVAPPVIRIGRFTVLPTGGTALTKTAKDTALSSNASITVWGDASADGTSSATTLTITTTANWLTQEFAPRQLLTGTAASAFYEPMDRAEYLNDEDIVLRPLEGIVVFLDYVLATQNPVTDMWLVTCDWFEL